jgi:16S rRNA (cytosine967-C5)-methyltransferase
MTDNLPNPRKRASQMLIQVISKHQPLEDVLSTSLKGLEPRDRALARAIASTCLRHLGIIDTLIEEMLDRPLPQAASNVRNALRVGITQLLFMDIPSHAAVNDTVDLIPANSKFRGLVNALLRRTDRQGKNLLDKMNLGAANTPDWLWDSWSAHYGEDMALKLTDAHLKEAPLDINVISDLDKWAKELDAFKLPTGHLRRKAGGSIIEMPGFSEGQWWIQDFSASLPAKLFGSLEGKRVLDLCAAPGGKTAQLINMGGDVTALDRSAPRLERLKENMARLGLDVTIKVADATGFMPPELFDAILLDAPCSSTGTIRRHPDVTWLKSHKDVDQLAALQTKLLDATLGQLKVGGTLVFSTCSLQPEEGEWQAEEFLKRQPNMSRVPVTADELDGLSELINDQGDIRSLPCHLSDIEDNTSGGMDGFFAARFVKG